MTALSNVDRVSYRNILMTGVTTERFNQELVYAPGEADPQFTRYHLQIGCYLHLDTEHFMAMDVFSQAPPPLNNNAGVAYPDAATKSRAIQSYLSQPKGRFLYWSGGILMLDVGNPAAYGTDTADQGGLFPVGVLADMNNGPMPEGVEVTETAAGNIYRVRFGIRFAIQLCEGAEGDPGLPADTQITTDPPQSDVTSVVNSWSYVESKDQRFWSTKTLTGSIRVRNIYDWSHSLRWLTVPPLQKTYRRQAQRFVQSTDKMTLEYTITDKQEYAAPPAPATDWSCRYHQAFSGPVAKEKIETVSIRLDGAPGTNKQHLVKTAYEVVRAILPGSMDPTKRSKFEKEEALRDADRFPVSFLHFAQIIDYVSEETIELIVSFRSIIPPLDYTRTAGKEDKTTIQNLYIDQVGIFPNILVNDTANPGTYHDRAVWPEPGLYDSNEPIGIFANYIQSACGARHGITQPYQLTVRDGTGQIVDGPRTDPYGTRPGLYGTNGSFAEVWATSQPVQPEDYDNRAATDLVRNAQTPLFEGEMRFPYTEIEMETDYHEDQGVIYLPKANTAAAPPTVEVFSYRAPVLVRTSRAVASRVGGWPRMPSPEKTVTTDDATETLVDYKVIFEEPRPEEDERTPTYRAHGLIQYVVDRPICNMTRLRTGNNPAITWDLENSMIETAKLTADMFGGDITTPPP